MSVAAALEMDGDTIKAARIALGGVAHKPWRDPEAEVGKMPTHENSARRQAAGGTKGYGTISKLPVAAKLLAGKR